MIHGDKIKRIREIKGLTQEDVAKKLNLTHQAYSRMERGETNISAERIVKIAEVLDVSVDDIFKLDDKKIIINSNTNHGETKDNAIQFHLTINESDKAIEILEKMIKSQQEEIIHLRKQVDRLSDQLFAEKKQKKL